MADEASLVGGTRLEALTALRTALAASLEAAEPREAASLSKELRAVLGELAALAPVEGSSAVDEVANKRAARRAGAANSEPAGRRGQPRRSNGSHRT